MMKNFRTRQNQHSLFLDFRPENGMNSCRKWDGLWRNGAMGRYGDTAMGRKREWPGGG